MFNIAVGVFCLFVAWVVKDNMWLWITNIFLGVLNILIGLLRVNR